MNKQKFRISWGPTNRSPIAAVCLRIMGPDFGETPLNRRLEIVASGLGMLMQLTMRTSTSAMIGRPDGAGPSA